MKFRSKSGKVESIMDLIESGEPAYIDPLILASACSAQYVCFEGGVESRDNMDTIHKAMTFVMGYPIWSHELYGNDQPWKSVGYIIRKQYPRMPHYHGTSRKKGNPTGRKILRIYGNDLLPIQSAGLKRNFNPLEDLRKKFSGVSVIGIVAP